MTTPAFLYRILLFLMLFFLCVPSAWAQQTIDWAKVHTLCIEMMNEMYNLRFPEAEQKAAAVIATAPSDPRGYFFRAMIHYYQCTFNQDEKGKKNDYSKFLGSAAKVETVCDQLLKYNENDSKAKFYKGGIVGYRGLLRFMSNEDLMKAVWDGRDAFNLLTEATEDDPNNADAQFGLGLFKYLLTQAPDWVKPYIKLAGLKGDRVQGLTMMEKAAVNGVYARSEARRWLSNFYAGLDPYKSRGAAHLKILADQYPQSWYLRQQLGRYYLGNLRNATDAIPQFQKLLALAPNARILSPNEVGSMACFYMALAQYYKN
ncbi:MAG: hypothetical protein JNL32_10265, partial [Candidatus Kapabacteria bacterium]|nr:hypothetical protein [Candidatus Kapabacteria bacterium]